MEAIRKKLNAFTEQSNEDWKYFSSKFQLSSYPKKSSLLKVGQVEKKLSFLEKGILRLYVPKVDNDITLGFVFPRDFVSAYDSFLTQTPSHYQVEALTDARLWQITYEDLQKVYANTKIGNEMGRKSAENLYLIKTKRELALLTKTAEERYQDLFSERPELIQHIPLKYVASYIGVTPQALSRIRKRIS
ncbi:MAG: CarD family transcriptional regulator [Flavobacteriales bacterium]|nr:CarD family transcriptional regulator [Flavobacteriales bacterium]|tara:strand:- start:9518 stop:10084 length:567 start_codon:yes stop_codon:yes gene_type:complete